MDDFKELLCVIAIIAAIMSSCFIILCIPAYAIESYKCSQYAERTNRFTDYSFATGCFVEGIPMEEFTARTVTNEQR